MLRESLKVVEAARQLKLTLQDGRTVADVRDPVQLALAIDTLRRSIESFDESTGSGRGRPMASARPDFATPPQMDDEGFIEDRVVAEGDAIIGEMDSIDEEELDEMELREEESRQKDVQAMVAAMAAASPVVFPLRAGLRPSDIPDDALDGVFIADDTVEQLEIGLDLIEDRLGYAVSKSGWSYRLRGLAEAAVQAMGSLDLLVDKERDESWVAMPAQSFSHLMQHVTDVSLNHDLRISLPVPQPQSLSDLGRTAKVSDDLDHDALRDSDANGFDDDSLSPFDAAM